MLPSNVLQQFLETATDSAEREKYDNHAHCCMDGIPARMQSKRFFDEYNSRCMATFILVKMEDDTSSGCGRWQIMQNLGNKCMWDFLRDNVHRLSSSAASTIMTCAAHQCIILLLDSDCTVFLKAKCWDDTMPGQDGITEWICASMYALAFSSLNEGIKNRIPASSLWDLQMTPEREKHIKELELAFAMGTHERLGQNSIVYNVFANSDVAKLLHDLCFQTHQEQMQREDVIKFIKSGSF